MESAVSPKYLAVLLHAFTKNPASLEGLRQAVQEAYPYVELDFFCPQLPLGLFSTEDPVALAVGLADQIDGLWEGALADGAPYDRIILVGHSVGSLLARKLYVIACGETALAPFEPAAANQAGRDWASEVERIVLLAGMNRGWRVSHHLSLVMAPIWWIGTLAGRIWEAITGRRVLILGVRVGAEFITQLRIQWLRMRRAAQSDSTRAGGALVVQLLGSIDDMVSPRDNVDLVAGEDFVYLDVPYTGHASIVDLNDETVKPGETQSVGSLRRGVIVEALQRSPEDLRRRNQVPDDLNALAGRYPEVEEVVFVIHGIRDEGYWTHKIGRAIRKQAGERGALIATETSSYGYFPMLGFLFAFERRKKVEWLMDQYAEAVALYPKASCFHFVGHSNGTYCLLDALSRYSCCRFSHVVLAGCVGRSRLDWERFVKSSQTKDDNSRHGSVEKVLNFVATGDWIVAGFPRLFETLLPIQRLGGAGHVGFSRGPESVTNLCYVRGGHGAAIVEPLWPAIASFVLEGKIPEVPAKLRSNRRAWYALLLGAVPPLIWLAAFGIAAVAGWLLWYLGDVLAHLTGFGWIPAVFMTLFGIGLIRLLRWV